jgi:hypothetical protein
MRQAAQSEANRAQSSTEPARSGSAQRQAVVANGPLAQRAAMMNSSPQVQALEQLNLAAHQSLPLQRLMNLTGEISSGRTAKWNGIPIGQQVVQRELYEGGDFTEPEPEVTEDYETLRQNDTWHFLKEGLRMFTSSAAGILGEIEKLPNLVLTLSTSTEIDSIGKTTLKLVSPEREVYTSESGHYNSATIQQWSRWLGNPKTRAAALVQVNPNQIANAAQVAHTLNHEVFLHAVEILNEIKHLKSIKDDKARETFALKNIRNPDKDHEDFVFGRRKDLIVNQSRMILSARQDNPVRARELVDDYKRDWAARREEMLKAAASKLWEGDERALREYATGIIKAFGSSAEEDAQAEVADMRNILSIIDYNFEAHLDDVWRKYRINLQPRIEEPRREEPVDLSALPTGPKKKEKDAEKEKRK